MQLHRALAAGALGMSLVAASPSLARAQISFGLGGGVTSPTSRLSDGYKSGYNVLATLGVAFLRVDAMFNQLDDKLDPSGHTQIWTVNANLVANLMPRSSPIVPYLIAGAGYYNNQYRVTASGSTIVGSGSTSFHDFGLNGGAGLRVNLAGIGVFGEARYHYVFQSGFHSQFIPITVGVVFGR